MSTYKNALKHTVTMALPMMSTRLVQTLNTFVSMVVMAQLGHTVLAASLPISMYRIVVMLIFISPLFVLGAMVGRQMHDQGKVNLPGMLVETWGLALVLCVLPVILYIAAGPLMMMCHQPIAVIPIITEYFKVQAFGMPALLLITVNQQFLAGMKHQHWVTNVSIISLIVNGVLSVGLTLGHFGMPMLGVEGAALASVISMWTTCVITTVLVLRSLPIKLTLKHWQQRSLQWSKLILKIGTPISLQVGAEMLSLMIITMFIGWIGQVAMAASQISQQYMLFAIVPIFGLSEAASIRVGHAIADKKPGMIRAVGNVSIAMGVAVTVIIGLVFALFHQPLLELFLRQSHVDVKAIYHLAMILLLIRVFSMLFDGVADVVTGVLRGLYDTRFPMVVSIICSWALMLPAAYLCGITFGYGMIGIAVGAGIARLIAASILAMRWRHLNIAERVTVSQQHAR